MLSLVERLFTAILASENNGEILELVSVCLMVLVEYVANTEFLFYFIKTWD